MAKKPPAVHIQSPRFQTQTLCGRPWPAARGGRLASEGFVPPIVVDERGSVNPATCRMCLTMLRRLLDAQNQPK